MHDILIHIVCAIDYLAIFYTQTHTNKITENKMFQKNETWKKSLMQNYEHNSIYRLLKI